MNELSLFLATQSDLRGLTKEQIEKLIECTATVYVKQGENLFTTGSMANQFYVIKKGRFDLSLYMKPGIGRRDADARSTERRGRLYAEGDPAALEVLPGHPDGAAEEFPRPPADRQVETARVLLLYRYLDGSHRCVVLPDLFPFRFPEIDAHLPEEAGAQKRPLGVGELF